MNYLICVKWIQERSSSRVFALGGAEKGREGGGEERSFFLFLLEEPVTQIELFEVT